MVRGLLAFLVACLVAPPAFADCADILPSPGEASGPRRGITTADLVELRDIGSPLYGVYADTSPYALSPDGQSIAFVLTRADLATNAHCRALVVLPVTGGPPRIVDRGGDPIIISDVLRGLFMPTGGSAMVVPSWSPDGQSIGYLKRVGGSTQVWRVRLADGRAEAVTRSPTDVDRWAWLSNNSLVFATRAGVAAAGRAIDAEALSGWRYDARIVTDNALRPQLREADVPQLPFTIATLGAAPRRASEREAAALPRDPFRSDPTSGVVIAPWGMRAGTEHDNASPLSQRRIWIEPPGGGRQTCSFAACDGGIVQLWWAEDGALLFQRREGWGRSRMALYRWTPDKGPPVRLGGDDDWLSGCLLGSDRLFCSAETSTRPAHLVAIDRRSGVARTIFDPNPIFAKLALGKVKRLYTRNDVGLDAWADLVLPPGYRPGTSLPLVIVQYESKGFLRGGTGDDYPIFLLAARGFAVLSFQGPPTVGSNRSDLDTWDKVITAMTQDWAERKSILSSLLSAVDQTVARGVADPERIGITGLSDGASTVEYGLINTRRFAAAAVSSCCEDPQSVMTYGGIAWADWNRAVRKYPLASEDGTAFWKKLSLAVNARALDTPLLMQLADREYLIGLETFTALREQRNPVDLYVFPDEYHVKWQPMHRRAVYERAIDWFAFWLMGKEDPDPAKLAQYQAWRAMQAARPATRSSTPPSSVAN